MKILATYTNNIHSFHVVDAIKIGDLLKYGDVYMPIDKTTNKVCVGVKYCHDCIFDNHCNPSYVTSAIFQKYFPTLKSDYPELFI